MGRCGYQGDMYGCCQPDDGHEGCLCRMCQKACYDHPCLCRYCCLKYRCKCMRRRGCF